MTCIFFSPGLSGSFALSSTRITSSLLPTWGRCSQRRTSTTIPTARWSRQPESCRKNLKFDLQKLIFMKGNRSDQVITRAGSQSRGKSADFIINDRAEILPTGRLGFLSSFLWNFSLCHDCVLSDVPPNSEQPWGQYFQTSTAVNYESTLIFYGSGIFISFFIAFNLRP